MVTPALAPKDQPEPEADARLTLQRLTSFELSPETDGRAAAPSGSRTAVRSPTRWSSPAWPPGKTIGGRARAGSSTARGPPPGETYGGTVALQAGQVNFVTADFSRGEYVLLCFVPDSGDGRPHVAHGMVRQISVE